jgi:integrase
MANITNLAMAEYEIIEYIKPEVTKRTTKKKKEEYLSKLASHKLTSLADSYLTGRLNKKGKPISEGYKQKFYDVISHYTKFNHGIEPVITEITKENVSRFKMYLQQRMIHNGYTTYLNKLRTIFCYAVDNDFIVKSPIPRKGLIEGYKKVEKDILNENEVRKIFQIPDNCLTPSQAKAKYCFLFMVLTGIGYGEMRSIRKEHLKNLDADLYIQKEREKTPVVYKVVLSSFAIEILEKIKNKNENDDSLFNKLYSVELMLRRLKQIAQLSSIGKNLTTYLGRHTFATDMANNVIVCLDCKFLWVIQI